MKTLDQVEPRTPIHATHTPGDAANVFIIKAPGSYYLTANLSAAANVNGIAVTADNVSIDLNGFTLTGWAGTGNGVSGANHLRAAGDVATRVKRAAERGIVGIVTNGMIRLMSW